jgi:hypothetical protein
MLKIARVLIASAIVLLMGCRKIEFDQTVGRDFAPSEAMGYLAGIFSGQEGFAFRLTNMDTQVTKIIPFVSQPINDHKWHIYDPAVQILELPPGSYRVTSWIYKSPNVLSSYFKKGCLSAEFEVKAGRISCIGKFDGKILQRGNTTEWRIDFGPYQSTQFVYQMSQEYPNFRDIPVDFCRMGWGGFTKPQPKPGLIAPFEKIDPIKNVNT